MSIVLRAAPHGPRTRDAARGLALALAVALVTAGCTDRAPWAGQGTVGNDCFPESTCERGAACIAGRCQTIGFSGRPGADAGPLPLPLSCPGLARPRVDAPPATTPHLRVALSGQATTPAVALLIAGVGEPRIVPLATNGAFCEEFALSPGKTARFELLALDGRGCASAPTVAEVGQRASVGSNVLAGIVPFANGEVRGPLSRLTDGDPASFSEIAFRERGAAGTPNSDCDASVYLWFPLAAPAEVTQLVLRYPPEGLGARYLRCWSLLSSTAAASDVARPAIGASGWRALGGMKAGAAGDFLFNFPAQRVTQLALLLFEDGNESDDETFAIAELEALRSQQGPAFVGCAAR